MRRILDIFKTCLLLIPVLIILGHDIIPHHHHQDKNSCHKKHTSSHEHQSGLDLHSHNSSEDNICSFNHNSFLKKFYFQIVLNKPENSKILSTYKFISKHRLENIPIKVKFLLKTFYLRGPPTI